MGKNSKDSFLSVSAKYYTSLEISRRSDFYFTYQGKWFSCATRELITVHSDNLRHLLGLSIIGLTLSKN